VQLKELSASEQQHKKLAQLAHESFESLKLELESVKRHLKNAELAADASREQCSTLQLRLAQAGYVDNICHGVLE
jgi:hypothetical protein